MNYNNSKNRRAVVRNVARSNMTTNGTTRALIERSRSANSRNLHIMSPKDYISSTMAKSQAGTTKSSTNMPKKGVFTKANERKKRSTTANSGIDRDPPNKFTPRSGASSAQEDGMDDEHMSDYIDISAVDDIMEDKDLTETSIDDEMMGNLASKYIGDNRTVEFIGCSPSSNHENYLSDEFRFIQTLPRSYKVQEDVAYNDAESFTSDEMISEKDKEKVLLSKFDMTKSVKSILTVQEKLAQDYPSLPPQVKYDNI